MKKRAVLFTMLFMILISVSAVFQAQDDLTTLAYGDVVTATITEDLLSLRYEFEGTEGDVIYISARSINQPNFLYLELFSPRGSLLEESFDTVSTALIAPYTLPRDGVYSFTVNRVDWSESTGDIEVVVNTVEPSAITSGESIESTLANSGAMDIYTFDAQAGDVLGVTMNGAQMEMAFASPSDPYFDSYNQIDSWQLPPMILPEDGTYTIYVQSEEASETPYTMTVDLLPVITLEAGDTDSNTIASGQARIYKFDAVVDDVWNIDTSFADETYSAWIELYPLSVSTNAYVADYGSGPEGSPRIASFIAPATDTYFIILQFNNEESGTREFAYDLTLSETKLASIVIGQTVNSSVNQESGDVIINYQGRIDDYIKITFELTGGDGEPGLTIRSPEDTMLQYYARGGRNASFDLLLRQEGLYQIIVSNVSYDEGSSIDFMLKLEEAE